MSINSACKGYAADTAHGNQHIGAPVRPGLGAALGGHMRDLMADSTTAAITAAAVDIASAADERRIQ